MNDYQHPMRSFWALLLAVVMLAGTSSTSHAFGQHAHSHYGGGHASAVDASYRDKCEDDGAASQVCCDEVALQCAADATNSTGHGLPAVSLSIAAFHPWHDARLRAPGPEAAIPPPRV